MPEDTHYLSNHVSTCYCDGCVGDRRHLEMRANWERTNDLLQKILEALIDTQALVKEIKYIKYPYGT